MSDTDPSRPTAEPPATLRQRAARTGRFILVGLAATATQYVGTIALASQTIGLTFAIAYWIAFAAALGLSYFGHHGYTFRKRGAHRVFGPRFVLGQCGLAVLFGLLGQGIVGVGFSTHIAAAIGAIGHPIASYFLHSRFTFAR